MQNRPLVLGVAGGSGSGKTTVMNAILERVGIPKSAVIAKPGGPEQSPGTPEIACHPANLDSEFAGTPTTLRSSQ